MKFVLGYEPRMIYESSERHHEHNDHFGMRISVISSMNEIQKPVDPIEFV